MVVGLLKTLHPICSLSQDFLTLPHLSKAAPSPSPWIPTLPSTIWVMRYRA